MPPEPVTFPERRFVLTQTVGGVETNVIQSTPLPNNYTSDQTVRLEARAQANQAKVLQPGILYKLYGPSNGGPHTDGDLIWRSDIDYGGTG
jgi:hypothetical protein